MHGVIQCLLVFVLLKRSNGSVDIKCNNNLTLGEISPENMANSTSILTYLLDIEQSKLKFSKFEGDENENLLLSSKAMNPFMNALHLAFSEHLVLELSPDMLWYLVEDAVGTFIRENAEKMSDLFVDFSGKKKLVVVTGKIFTWNEVISTFNTLLNKNTKNPNKNLFISNFTTTSTESLTVSQIARMNSMQKYFDFTVWTLCGIPTITLLGERADWVKLVGKVNDLVGLVDEWSVWKRNLNEILNKFVEVYDREVDVEFWNNIYKVGGLLGSGGPFITGWATNFFPYLSKKETNTPTLTQHWRGIKHHFKTNDFNSKLSTVEFLWKNNGLDVNMTIYGGLYGCRYNHVKRSLLPVFGYGIYKN